jgi:hypothetical protein
MSRLRFVLSCKIKEAWIEVVLDVDELLRDLRNNLLGDYRNRFWDNLGLRSWLLLGRKLRRLLSAHSA